MLKALGVLYFPKSICLGENSKKVLAETKDLEAFFLQLKFPSSYNIFVFFILQEKKNANKTKKIAGPHTDFKDKLKVLKCCSCAP